VEAIPLLAVKGCDNAFAEFWISNVAEAVLKEVKPSHRVSGCADGDGARRETCAGAQPVLGIIGLAPIPVLLSLTIYVWHH
jgi:hypothetical protein